MHPPLTIEHKYKDSYINIALDTIRKQKQALIFVSSKRGAEKSAEEISKKIKDTKLEELKTKILKVLSKPTKQCTRLANCIEKGIAFHHAGLHSKQKELIETAFRNNIIKIIACTPTLAAGLDMPAFRTILKDVKRYSHMGYNYIPTLEYHQMAGRAGRPGMEDYGESIMIASTESHSKELLDRFINGDPEQIFSKLAVEPVLRTYTLSLIATGFARTKKSLMKFFAKTFWAYQYQETTKLHNIIEKMIHLLQDYGFIKTTQSSLEFKPANETENIQLRPTLIGKRVAELYLDPLTAHHLITCLQEKQEPTPFGLIQMASHTLEMRPLLRVGTREFGLYQEEILKNEEELLEQEPDIYDYEYDEFLNSLKTTLFFNDWIDENNEEFLLNKFNIRPGEISAKLNIIDWLLYASVELAKISNLKHTVAPLNRLRFRLKHGIREELLPLCRLKGISKIRARKLYNNGIKTLREVKSVDIQTLSQLLGNKLAENLKEQVGQNQPTEISKHKRKGQMGLSKY